MRELATHLVVAQRGDRSVSGLTGSFPAAEGIRRRRCYLSRAKTYTAKQISDSTGQPGDSIHRMHDHICGGGHGTYSARGQRFGKYIGVTRVIERRDCRNLGQPYLQQIESLDVVGTRVLVKNALVGDDRVLAHRTVSRHLWLNGKSRPRKRIGGQKVGRVDDRWFLILPVGRRRIWRGNRLHRRRWDGACRRSLVRCV